MIKARFGGSVASRLPTAQVNEVLAMCFAHNLCCLVKAIFTGVSRQRSGRTRSPCLPKCSP
jgi:hypothetical protein